MGRLNLLGGQINLFAHPVLKPVIYLPGWMYDLMDKHLALTELNRKWFIKIIYIYDI